MTETRPNEVEHSILEASRTARANLHHYVRHGASNHLDERHGADRTTLWGGPAGTDYARTYAGRLAELLRLRAEERAVSAALVVPSMGNEALAAFETEVRSMLPSFEIQVTGQSLRISWETLVKDP